MKTYRYGNIDGWLEQGEGYELLNEAWWRCMCVAPQFLYVYEDNELILVLDVGLDMYIEVARELLAEHRIEAA